VAKRPYTFVIYAASFDGISQARLIRVVRPRYGHGYLMRSKSMGCDQPCRQFGPLTACARIADSDGALAWGAPITISFIARLFSAKLKMT
jgi:hypothetical protein